MPKLGHITSIAELRARCCVDPSTHCWNWTGGLNTSGVPRVYGIDYAIGDKRVMVGTQAVWNLAHQEAPPRGNLVMRACGNRLCLNPAHLRLMRSKAEMGEHVRRAGYLKGTAVESRRANLAKARAAAGVVPTPDERVRAIRAADASTTNRALARQLGVTESTVSAIRLGHRHKGVI